MSVQPLATLAHTSKPNMRCISTGVRFDHAFFPAIVKEAERVDKGIEGQADGIDARDHRSLGAGVP